jgi:DNA modification methylase
MSHQVIHGDCREVLKTMPDRSVHCIVTSPPYYGLRDYGVDGQIGLEHAPDAYVAELVAVFREARRVLRDDGAFWLNIGDSYFGSCQTGGTNSKEGSAKRAGRMFSRAGHAQSCDSDDTEELGFRGRGSLSGNPYGGRTDAWWSRIAGSDARLALVQAGEPLSQIRECMAALAAHLPNEGSSPRKLKRLSSAAILDQAHSAVHAVEQLYASLPSIPGECAPPLLVGSRLSDIVLACLSSLQSFAACVQACAHMLDAPSQRQRCTADTASPFEELACRIQCTVGLCSTLLAWVEYKPQRPTLKRKDLIMIPARMALALQADGWYLRSEIIWSKPNPMPESIRDRPTSAHEKVYLFAKSSRYFYDADAVKEKSRSQVQIRRQPNGLSVVQQGEQGGAPNCGVNERRNLRNVWTITPKPYKGAHLAVMPIELAETCIKAGCPEGGIILDPFGGVGTTGVAAARLKRRSICIELSQKHANAAIERIGREVPMIRGAQEAPLSGQCQEPVLERVTLHWRFEAFG